MSNFCICPKCNEITFNETYCSSCRNKYNELYKVKITCISSDALNASHKDARRIIDTIKRLYKDGRNPTNKEIEGLKKLTEISLNRERENPTYKIITEKEQSPNIPKCPTCQSTNVHKISGTRRFLSTGFFGLASSDLGKTMECNNCGYKW